MGFRGPGPEFTRPTYGRILSPAPVPQPPDRYRLPASYANFYVANAAVLVPTFNDPQDRVALGTLADLFPDRPVVGIHAVDLVLGFGNLALPDATATGHLALTVGG